MYCLINHNLYGNVFQAWSTKTMLNLILQTYILLPFNWATLSIYSDSLMLLDDKHLVPVRLIAYERVCFCVRVCKCVFKCAMQCFAIIRTNNKILAQWKSSCPLLAIIIFCLWYGWDINLSRKNICRTQKHQRNTSSSDIIIPWPKMVTLLKWQ